MVFQEPMTSLNPVLSSARSCARPWTSGTAAAQADAKALNS